MRIRFYLLRYDDDDDDPATIRYSQTEPLKDHFVVRLSKTFISRLHDGIKLI